MRLPADLDAIDALIIPGGESTTIGRLATLYGMIYIVFVLIASTWIFQRRNLK